MIKSKKKPGCEHMVLSSVFVRLHYFGWSPLYDCKTYLESNIVQNCSYFGFGGYFLVAGTIVVKYSVDL